MNRGILASIGDIAALVSPRVSAGLRHHEAEPKSGITDCPRFAENVKTLARFLATTPKNR